MTYDKPFPIGMRLIKSVFFAVLCMSAMMVVLTKNEVNLYAISKEKYLQIMMAHNFVVDRFYNSHKDWQLSKLGDILFKNDEFPKASEEKQNKTFLILIWKRWDFLKHRHLYNYGANENDPLSECSVKNCVFTGDDDKFDSADAVIVHLHHGEIPQSKNRNPNQRWIFLNDESPMNAFSQSKHHVPLKSLHNVFNWSMTYLCNADVPVPYGRTVPLNKPKYFSSDPPITNLVPNWEFKQRDVLVGILMSNCRVMFRNDIIWELKRYIKVDVHGTCGDDQFKKSCPGHFRSDCDKMSNYLFYLSLENSKCTEYMTEKLFHNAYHRGAIPIIQGASKEDCELFLPPKSYIHVDDYRHIKDLAEDIKRISENKKNLLYYHQWRNHFEIVNEHGFFKTKSYHLCRVCEAMNYNDDSRSVYSYQRIRQFLDKHLLCRY